MGLRGFRGGSRNEGHWNQREVVAAEQSQTSLIPRQIQMLLQIWQRWMDQYTQGMRSHTAIRTYGEASRAIMARTVIPTPTSWISAKKGTKHAQEPLICGKCFQQLGAWYWSTPSAATAEAVGFAKPAKTRAATAASASGSKTSKHMTKKLTRSTHRPQKMGRTYKACQILRDRCWTSNHQLHYQRENNSNSSRQGRTHRSLAREADQRSMLKPNR